MSALSKIRENVGLVIILIAISLAAFILTDLFTGLGGVSVDTTAGEVAGNDIEINYLTARTQQIRDRGVAPTTTDADIDMQAWGDILREIVYDKEWEDVGMLMSDEEINMLYYGPIVHPYLFNDPSFRDSTGNYSPLLVRQTLELVDQWSRANQNVSPEQVAIRDRFIDLRRIISRERLSQKWTRMVAAAQLVSDNEVQQAYEDQSRTVDISYVSVPYTAVPSDQAQVTDEDFQRYFDENKAQFKTNGPTLSIKYTYFPMQPSPTDRSGLVREMTSNYKVQFGKVANPFDYAQSATNVLTLQQDTTYKLPSDMPEAVQGITVLDTVIGPVPTAYGLGLYRIVDMQEDSTYAYNIRHIMIRPQAEPGQPLTAQDSAQARQKVNDLRAQVLADRSQFGALAKDNSDYGFSAIKDGELGWVDPNAPIDFQNPQTQADPTIGGDFRDDLSNASEGSVFVTSSAQGFHVVEVLERSNKKYRVAEIGREIKVSSATRDSIYKRAGQYAGQAKAGANMDSLLSGFPEANTNVTPTISPDVYVLQNGELEKPREMIAWGFQSDAGDLSQRIFDVGNAFVVAKVRSKSDGEYLSVESLKTDPQTRLKIQNEKKAQIILGKLGGGSDLAQIASGYGAGATTGSAQGISFASNQAGGLGDEPKVVGRSHGMAEGEISAPIEGLSGVYIIKVEKINEPAGELMDAMKGFQRQQIASQQTQQAVQQAQQAIFDLADIKDYRYMFDYREETRR